MNNINYIIFNISELSAVNFEEVLQTSTETIRKSIDNSKTFVKWIGDSVPQSLQNITTKEGPYTHSEILEILNTEEWFQSTSIIIND